MALGPTLPPQAYTREILTAAFNWLQTQPESVRKLAVTPDALVGLYMRAQRYGNSTLETDAPVSSQNFMSDLKNLAEGLKQFEQPSSASAGGSSNLNSMQAMQVPLANHSYHPNRAQPESTYSQRPMTGSPINQMANQMTPQMAAQITSQMQAQIPLQTPTQLPSPNTLRAMTPQAVGLNDMSLRMVQEVRNHLNLSSDAEVINMMLALAYKNLKSLLG